MNYIAKINDIDKTLQARETPPWLDFLVKYTYPLVIVDYGSLNLQSVGDSLGKCVEENAREFGGELKDYILSEALSFMQSLSFQYSSAASCEELYSTENQPETKEFEKDFGYGEAREAKKNIQSPRKLKTEEDIENQVSALRDSLQILQDQQNEIIKQGKKLDDDIENIEKELSDPNTKWSKSSHSGQKKASKQIERNTLVNKKQDMDNDITKVRREISFFTSNYGESTSSARRIARKAAAKKARRNKKSPIHKKAAKIALEDIKKSDTLLTSLIDPELLANEGKLSFNKVQRNNEPDFMKSIISRLSICNATALTVNAVRCLFSGVTKKSF